MNGDFARTTISVPGDLKARMNKVRSQVNWSAVACQAFEEKLEELGPIEEITSVEDALKRMKSIKAENESSRAEANQTGHAAGTHWAMNFARPGQLRRMEAFRKEHSDSEWNELLTSPDGYIELGKCIVPPVAPGREHPNPPPMDREQPGRHRRGRHRKRMEHSKGGPFREKHVWRRILDQRPEHPKFFLGFATGALEVWDQIKDQL